MSAASPTRWWHTSDTGKVVCTLCPRECHIPEGSRGFCFVRANEGGELKLTTWGRSSGFCIDPIEKKPLNHFLPGTPVLSFGTAGCNLGCKFCQNWDISKSRQMDTLAQLATPETIVEAAKRTGCRSLAFTYNDPTIWAEYAIDIARVARQEGIKTVAVTAGYISPEARGEFYEWMDAANVDLKGFTDRFYRKLCQGELRPVLDCLKYLRHETSVWFEITNLMIPGENDSPDETAAMCDWIVKELGPDVPVHFTAFHPDFKMLETPGTPAETLARARDIAVRAGIHFAYVGNVHDAAGQSTYCPGCGKRLIERDWYQLGEYALDGNQCRHCGLSLPGVFDDNGKGDWGRKRVPISIHQDGVTVRMTNSTSSSKKSLRAAALEAQMKKQQQGKDAETPGRGDAEQESSSPRPRVAASPHPDEKPVAAATAAEPRLDGVLLPGDATPRTDFTEAQQQTMLAYTREVVAAAVEGRPVRTVLPPDLADAPTYGIFVTLSRPSALRGCRGRWGRPVGTLSNLLTRVAHDTALGDPRFPALHADELPLLDLDISLMYDPREMTAVGEDRIAAVDVGSHGLVVVHARGRGLLLPNVATENGWDAKTFLDRTCHKAGLPPDTWRRDPSSRIMTFRTLLYSQDAPRRELDIRGMHSDRLHELLLQANLMLRDAPLREPVDPFLLEPHGEELGIYLQTGSGLTAAALGMDHSLISLARTAVKSLQDICAKRRTELEPISRITLFWQPIRLQPADYPQRHAILGRCAVLARASAPAPAPGSAGAGGGAGKWSLIVPSDNGRPDKVLDALQAVDLSPGDWKRKPAAARLTAFSVLNFGGRLRPVGAAVRPAARAGQFYPLNADTMEYELRKHFDRASRGRPAGKPRPVRAVMLPHAGWRFCGDVIARVLSRVAVPRDVIVLGPKHTADGPNWSVAPHEQWKIPGGRVDVMHDLAAALTDRVPAMRREGEAHRLEHGTEVLLPFLRFVQPELRVLPIVLGRCSFEATTELAAALHELIADLDEPPLLVISSDMNHYAADAENRRLDALALEAMRTGDPRKLYETCRDHDISMCGVLPAVTVMQLLRLDTAAIRPEVIDYDTSAAATGDASRVVGYAGVAIP